jgi:hypothetical protein
MQYKLGTACETCWKGRRATWLTRINQLWDRADGIEKKRYKLLVRFLKE